MKRNMKKIILVSSFTMATFLTACGVSSSNPLEKYDGIKGVPATSDQKALPQTAVKPELFYVQVEGTNQSNIGHFIEGQDSQVLIKITPRSQAIQAYSVQLVDFTHMARPTLVQTDTPGIYSLNWHPPVGTIASGFQQSFKAQIQVTVVQAKTPQLESLITTKDLDVSVSRNSTQPKIVGRTDLSKGVEEGQTTKFTLDVVDPGSANSPRMPEIQVTPYISANTEAYRADGSRFVGLDETKMVNPERIGKNTFRFYLTLTPENMPLDRDRKGREIPSATDVDMCFHVRVISVVGTMSDQPQVCTKVRYAAQPPEIVFDETNLSTVTAGQESLISLKVTSAHSKAVIVIPKLSLLLAGLSGKKEALCDFESPDRKNVQICVIRWIPACVKTPAQATITVKADSNLAGKVKSSSLVKTITVQPSDDCPVVTAKPTSRSTKKGTK